MGTIGEVVKNAAKGSNKSKPAAKGNAKKKSASKPQAGKNTTSKSKSGAVVRENARGVTAKWRGFSASPLLRWLAFNEFSNQQVRFILNQIGLQDINDFTIGCQCGATRSALDGNPGKRNGKPISTADAKRGISFRGAPADVKGEDAAFLRAVAKRWKPESK